MNSTIFVILSNKYAPSKSQRDPTSSGSTRHSILIPWQEMTSDEKHNVA